MPGQPGSAGASPMPPLHLVPTVAKPTGGAAAATIATTAAALPGAAAAKVLGQRFTCALYSTNIDSGNASRAKSGTRRAAGAGSSKAPYWVHDIPLPIAPGSRPDDWRMRGTALYLDPQSR